MSKLQETAPEEIFLIVGPTNDTDFKELSDVTWADKPVYEETAIKYVKHPKLSIPKKVAEMLDVSFDFQPEYHEDISWIASNMDVLSDDFHYNEFYTWLDSGKDNYNIALAYLAGKALGVELVEVSDE